jgi:hypothetical protein
VYSAVIGAQDLESILEAHYKASASEEMGKVETIITHGRNVNSMAGVESAFTIYQSRPHKILIESEYQGSKVSQSFNGHEGWIYAPGMGISEPEQIKGDELETLLAQAEFGDPLWNFRQKGSTLELVGEDPKNSEYQIRLTTAKNQVRDFFISGQSFLITSFKTVQLMGGTETEIEVIMEDYREAEGIPMAHRLISKMNGQVVGTILIDKVEINRYIDPVKFDRPVTN